MSLNRVTVITVGKWSDNLLKQLDRLGESGKVSHQATNSDDETIGRVTELSVTDEKNKLQWRFIHLSANRIRGKWAPFLKQAWNEAEFLLLCPEHGKKALKMEEIYESSKWYAEQFGTNDKIRPLLALTAPLRNADVEEEENCIITALVSPPQHFSEDQRPKKDDSEEFLRQLHSFRELQLNDQLHESKDMSATKKVDKSVSALTARAQRSESPVTVKKKNDDSVESVPISVATTGRQLS
jgi:hypothetical protein